MFLGGGSRLTRARVAVEHVYRIVTKSTCVWKRAQAREGTRPPHLAFSQNICRRFLKNEKVKEEGKKTKSYKTAGRLGRVLSRRCASDARSGAKARRAATL